jgi:hypothetical protein
MEDYTVNSSKYQNQFKNSIKFSIPTERRFKNPNPLYNLN